MLVEGEEVVVEGDADPTTGGSDPEPTTTEGAVAVADATGGEPKPETVEPKPEVEVEKPQGVDPKQVRGLISQAITSYEAQKDLEQSRLEMDKLYDADKEAWAEKTRANEELDKTKEKLAEEASTEYYTNLFRKVLPNFTPELQALTEEEQRELDPYSDKWTDDGEYLLALVSKVVEKRAGVRMTAKEATTAAATAANGRAIVDGNKAVVPDTPGVPSDEGVIDYAGQSSRDVMAATLKDVYASDANSISESD